MNLLKTLLKDHGHWIALAGLPLWLVIGFLPLALNSWNTQTAGQTADSFGIATSLFTGVGFIFALVALMMQIKESHESGQRQYQQDALQAEQVRLQGEQAKIAKSTAEIAQRTAELQESIRLDAHRAVKLRALLKAYSDAVMHRKVFEWYKTSTKTDDPAGQSGHRMNQAEADLLCDCFEIEMLFGSDEVVENVLAKLKNLAQIRNELDSNQFLEIQFEKVEARFQAIKSALATLCPRATA